MVAESGSLIDLSLRQYGWICLGSIRARNFRLIGRLLPIGMVCLDVRFLRVRVLKNQIFAQGFSRSFSVPLRMDFVRDGITASC